MSERIFIHNGTYKNHHQHYISLIGSFQIYAYYGSLSKCNALSLGIAFDTFSLLFVVLLGMLLTYTQKVPLVDSRSELKRYSLITNII